MATQEPTRVQPYEKVVDFLINEIETSKTLPWEHPWINKDCSRPINFRGSPYRGVNLMNLWFIQSIRGYKQNVWLTFNQCRELKGTVKKGEHGVPVVFWKILVKKGTKMVEKDEDEDGDETKIPFMRAYTVFNIEQCDLPAEVLKKYTIEEKEFVPIEEAARIIRDMKNKPQIFEDQISQAYYKRSDDSVHVPAGKYFKNAAFYYSTMFHELIHSTGHDTRLNRDSIAMVDGLDQVTYSEEELVAEFGSVFLCSLARIEKEPTKDHVAYLQNWLTYIKDHKKALIFAAQRAQKAVDYIVPPVQ